MKLSRGFTLIELLVVIAIIGLLSSIVLASLNTARTKAYDAARKSDVKSLETAMQLYYNDNGGYPTSNTNGNGAAYLNDSILLPKLVPAYITSMPALLVADSDGYYANGVSTGVSTTGYDLLIYMAGTSSWCRAGTLPGNTSDWGVATVCNF